MDTHMQGILVSLDLETTGLDIQNDSIIEIGAVKSKHGEILEEYTQLINPGFEIPRETSHITGIYQDDLRHAPMLPQVLPEIRDFVGDAPVIAHNVDFDMGFMHRFGTFKDNLAIDTIELSSMLLPRMPRYNLSILTTTLGITLDNAHRALADARATALLYWHLWDMACALPHALIVEINEHSQPHDWALKKFFADVSQEQLKQSTAQDTSRRRYFQKPTRNYRPLAMNDSEVTLDEGIVSEHLGKDGSLAQTIEHYEERTQQLAMSEQVLEAFNRQKQRIIEAGTGTGKSLAYLLPAMAWADANQQRVVVATNTINLQDQLLTHDIPTLLEATPYHVKAVTMKGRNNYLCPRRLDALRRRHPNNLDELRTLTKILIWLEDDDVVGQRGEITLRGTEFFIWSRLSAQDEGCTTHHCAEAMHGQCPYYKARKEAEEAHLVIVNHALLVSDVLAENRILPEYQHLIIDEAHQLEDAITDGLTLRVDETVVLRRLTELGGANSGVMGDLLKQARQALPDKKVMKIEAFMSTVASSLQELSSLTRRYFAKLQQFLEETNNNHNFHVRVHDNLREKPAFLPMKDVWQLLNEYLTVITESLAHLTAYLEKVASDIVSDSDSMSSLYATTGYLAEVQRILHEFTFAPSSNQVYWIAKHNFPRALSIQCAPIHIGQTLEDLVWRQKRTVVLTSATLQTDAGFDYVQDRLFVDEMENLALGSPFDYQSSTLLYIPTDMPMPNESGYQRMVERGIIALATALEGRVMVLFTSYSQLKETATNITPRLALGDIQVYDQAMGHSREMLLEQFKQEERAVLLGTKSFWEGVDIPGEDLSALVIARLPFAVPSDPIFAARSENYDNAFKEYAIPNTILRFRQGFGRLIRTKQDKGVVAIFDSRIIKKRYGEQFLRALPECHRHDGQLEDLADVAKAWLSKE
jgi:ATP-dependent DNA helicase DinG